MVRDISEYWLNVIDFDGSNASSNLSNDAQRVRNASKSACGPCHGVWTRRISAFCAVLARTRLKRLDRF
jgi:hypothetical protein